MALSFLNAQKELGSQLGLDQTNTDTVTLLKRWLNFSRQDIVGFHPWQWLYSLERIEMLPDITTGTVSVSADSTTATLSATQATSVANRFIQFSSADDWYKITAHTAATDTLTIDPAYVQTSALTAGTYTIREVYYNLSSSAEFAYSCKQAITPRPVPIIPVERYDNYVPYPDSTGKTDAIYFWGYDADENWQFSPFPWPDENFLLDFRTVKKATDLTTDAQTGGWPQRFESTWILGGLKHGYRFMDDDRESGITREFEGQLKNMKARDEVGLTKHYVLQAMDRRPIRNLVIPFPPQFGHIRGI